MSKNNKKVKSREYIIQRYFNKNVDNYIKINNKKAYVIETEYPLMNAEILLTNGLFGVSLGKPRDILGRIDVIFRYNGKKYIGEIKDLKRKSFWYATKVLAYTKYLRWQAPDFGKIKGAVIIPKEYIKLEHQIIAGQLDIEIFVFSIKDKIITIENIGDKPYWKTINDCL